jgi:TRAP transporter TAXI family solute receptor
MPSRFAASLLVAFALFAAGCARGPDPAGLEADVQARLDALFGRPVLVVGSLNRQGSAPYARAADGARQAIVYFNATLEFAEAYDPSDWETLSPQLIARALGATDDGVFGLESGRMAPGAVLKAYGSLVYRREGEGWRPTQLQAPQAVGATQAAAPGAESRANELIERLATIVDTSPRLRGARDEIVAEELDRALQNIQLRLEQDQSDVAIATGPAGGEYARFVESLESRFGPGRRPLVATTAGSVENAFLIDQGRARFGLVQSDVAAAAVTGEGLFGTTGPLRHLRGAAALFPEMVHVVVREGDDARSVGELAGRRLSVGRVGSGSRQTGVSVLAAHGLGSGSYLETDVGGPAAAVQALAEGRVDAVVEVVSAPWHALAEAGAVTPLRLLPLDGVAIERAVAEVHGLLPLTIPARTYAGQEIDVPTVAATALLVVNAEVPEAVVRDLLEVLYSEGDSRGRSVRAARLSRERALSGVTLPLHDGAAGFFEAAPAAVGGPAPASAPVPVAAPAATAPEPVL